MSEVSQKELAGAPPVTHEQFDLLIAAMLLQMQLTHPDVHEFLKRKSDREYFEWLQTHLRVSFETMGNPLSADFDEDERMGIFFMYLDFYEHYTTVVTFKPETRLDQIQRSIRGIAVAALRSQLEHGECPNIVNFLCSFIPGNKRDELGKKSTAHGFRYAVERAKGIAYLKSKIRSLEYEQRPSSDASAEARRCYIATQPEPELEQASNGKRDATPADIQSPESADNLYLLLFIVGSIAFFIYWVTHRA